MKTDGTASVTGNSGRVNNITGNASTNLITFDHDLTYLADKNDNFLRVGCLMKTGL